eukprot:Transcript_17241.p1 GENE.Transcript_17241~~Transcript_17241.p1  ORF type:complete len:315 (+),score=18.67 Transcript_17241:850-1794(+)
MAGYHPEQAQGGDIDLKSTLATLPHAVAAGHVDPGAAALLAEALQQQLAKGFGEQRHVKTNATAAEALQLAMLESPATCLTGEPGASAHLPVAPPQQHKPHPPSHTLPPHLTGAAPAASENSALDGLMLLSACADVQSRTETRSPDSAAPAETSNSTATTKTEHASEAPPQTRQPATTAALPADVALAAVVRPGTLFRAVSQGPLPHQVPALLQGVTQLDGVSVAPFQGPTVAAAAPALAAPTVSSQSPPQPLVLAVNVTVQPHQPPSPPLAYCAAGEVSLPEALDTTREAPTHIQPAPVASAPYTPFMDTRWA